MFTGLNNIIAVKLTTMLHLYLFLASIYSVSGSVHIHAPCPNIKTAEDFNLNGICRDTWYQVARYSNDIETRADCIIISVNDNRNCKFDVTESFDGNVVKYGGHLTATEFPGIFNIVSPALSDEDVNKTLPVHVLAYDYDNFFFGYECFYNKEKKTHHDYAWVWSRKPTLEQKAKAELEELLSSHSYIDANKLIWNHFDDEYCPKI